MNRHGTSLRIFSVAALICLIASLAVLGVLALLPFLRTAPVYHSAASAGEFRAVEETDTVKALNTMTREEFEAARGIGPSLSEAAVALREEMGGFRFAEDLQAVNGIGDSKYQAVMELISGTP